MGHVYVQATIRGKRAAKVRFLADTDAAYGLISPEMARRLGITPGPIRDRVRPASGGTVRLPMALAAIRIDGRETGTIFWIGPCEEPLLGVERWRPSGSQWIPYGGGCEPFVPTRRDWAGSEGADLET